MTGEGSRRFSDAALEMLRQAGWLPGRNVFSTLRLPERFRLTPVATRVLAEFGNLRIGRQDRGLEVAQRVVEINPMLAFGENEYFAEAEAVLHCALCPVGDINGGQAFLALDDQERTFIVGDLLLYLGAPFDEALDRLLTGRRARPVDAHGRW